MSGRSSATACESQGHLSRNLINLTVLFLSTLIIATSVNGDVPTEVKQQIDRSKADITRIRNHILSGDGRHATFNRLAELGDLFGVRLTGTPELEKAIDYTLDNLTKEGFDNVHGENVTVPHWTRGEEWAELETPNYIQKLPILSLGSSVGTQNYTNGILIASIVVVKSFEDLDGLTNDQVQGKIVVYNTAWRGDYGSTVVFRSQGARRAEAKGAVAVLTRSVTQYSIASPHTGTQKPANISAACITIEDAEMLQRWYDRGVDVKVHLYMNATNWPSKISRNVVAEIKGSDFPESTVIFGGHIDTWDVGHGSMDDGGGVMIAWEALSVMKKLGLRPRRTIRLVLWTAEEQGLIGGVEYYEAHKNEAKNVSLIIESDGGAFKPRGIGFTGNKTSQAIMQEILDTNLADLNLTSIKPDAGSSSDTAEWVKVGVPGVELFSYNEDYFFYHHTLGDMMTVLNADDLDHCTLLWATVAYSVANLDHVLNDYNFGPINAASVLNYNWVFVTFLLIISAFVSKVRL